MYWFGITQALKIGLGYFVLIVLLPALIFGNRLKGEHSAKRFMKYVVFGNVHISTLVFTLAYLNSFSRLTLFLSIMLSSVLFYMLIHRKQLAEKIFKTKAVIKEILLGEYGISLLVARGVKKGWKQLRKLYNKIIRDNEIEWLIFLLIISYSLYQYGINSLEYPTYMAPDEEVHLYWIQSLIAGDIFPSGVYPHVFHTILAALIQLFKFNAISLILYFGMISNLLIMTMLYLGLRHIFKTKYAALFGFMLYTAMDLFLDQVTYRFQFSIPQEYAMIMLMPMAIFLFAYIKEKKRSDLVFFGFALSMTIGIHFYTGAIAVILAVAIGLTYLYKIIKEKIFLKLILFGFLSAVFALAPLGIGLASGYGLEQSFTWGAEVITGEVYTKPDEIKPDADEKTGITFKQFLTDAKLDIEKYLVHDVRTIYFLLFMILFTMLYNLFYLYYKKEDAESEDQIAFALNSLLLMGLILLKALNLPTIMELKRVAIYFAYFSSIFLGMPLEIASRLVTKTTVEKAVPVFSVGLIFSSALFIVKQDMLRPLPSIYYFQTTGSTLTNMKIIDEYADYTWTAVSPVNNISMIMNHGNHYELSEFIINQEDWNEGKQLRIPTEYVFLYIEKRPIGEYGWQFNRDELDSTSRPEITEKDALEDLSESSMENYHYINEREILMAKAYYWAQEYEEYFPKEIDVYYEDEELVVYQIKQNPHALNNFSIDYKINSR